MGGLVHDMTSVDRLARCLSNRRLADHLDGFVERERALYDPNGIAVAWLRESAKRLRECTCPRIIPAGGAAPLDAAGRRVDRGSGSPPVPDPDRHLTNEELAAQLAEYTDAKIRAREAEQ